MPIYHADAAIKDGGIAVPYGWTPANSTVFDAEKVPGGLGYGFAWQWLTPGLCSLPGGGTSAASVGAIFMEVRPMSGLVRQMMRVSKPSIEAIPGDFMTLSASPSVVYPREVTRDVNGRPIVQMFEHGPLWVIDADGLSALLEKTPGV